MFNKFEELEVLGGLQFSIDECSIMLQIDLEEEAKANKEIMITYKRGQLKASMEVRTAILKQAINGSTPAQKQMIELINKKGIKKLVARQKKFGWQGK